MNAPERDTQVQLLAGLLSLAAAVLSALHTFFNFADVTAQNKAAAAEYESVRHDLDAFILEQGMLRTSESPTAALGKFREIAKQLDDIAKRAPTIPDKIYNSTQTRVAERPVLAAQKVPNPKDPSPN
jgi:hypothetical protein